MNDLRLTLRLGDDELSTCVACGLCLPHCPTYRATGEEGASPRGRIAAMRAVQWEGAPADEGFVHFMSTCVQCRGCEPACPSGVPFGRLMEGTRRVLAQAHRTVPWWQRLAYRALAHHRTIVIGSRVAAVAQRARLVPKRLGLPALPLRARRLRSTGTDAWLFTGCVMDAWQRDVHAGVLRLAEAMGIGMVLPGRGGACCGALHVHAGLHAEARALAERVMGAFPGDAPIVVDSAGCGAALKDYGHLVGTPAAVTFSARVRDVHEWLAGHADRLPPAAPTATRSDVIVQDPCHLRHVQKAHLAVRTVLAPYARIVELDDDGLCCGAGGAYSALEPELAGAIRQRKLDAITRAKVQAPGAVVASANPGCSMHLAAAGVRVTHPVLIIEAAIDGR
jgi:glycolate oxidase iron-sulfur subunit